MECFHDFCLACDKESNGPYCSQACRLADLERANPCMTSPTTATSPSAHQSRLSWSSTASTSSYVLSPAYDFTDKAGQTQTSYFMRSDAQSTYDSASAQRSLTPSTSRTSLASTTSNCSSTNKSLSEQSQMELNDYFDSFSRAKASKRRPSVR